MAEEHLFAGQVVAVTGAGRGLGAACARYLAARGATVVVHDAGVRADGQGGDPSLAETVVSQIEDAGGSAVPVTGNLLEPGACEEVVDTAVRRFGRLDAVVHNAGVVIWRTSSTPMTTRGRRRWGSTRRPGSVRGGEDGGPGPDDRVRGEPARPRLPRERDLTRGGDAGAPPARTGPDAGLRRPCGRLALLGPCAGVRTHRRGRGGRLNLAREVSGREVDLGSDPTVEAIARWRAGEGWSR